MEKRLWGSTSALKTPVGDTPFPLGWVVDDKSFQDDRWAGMFFSVIQSGRWGNYLSGEYCLSPILSLSEPMVSNCGNLAHEVTPQTNSRFPVERVSREQRLRPGPTV